MRVGDLNMGYERGDIIRIIGLAFPVKIGGREGKEELALANRYIENFLEKFVNCES